jgi:hypothetical protein
LAEAFDGVINQGREQLNLLASTIGTQSEDDILAAEEMAEFEDCKDDPQVAPIPDPSVEEMKAFGIQVAGGYDVTEITNAAPALEPEQEATNAAPDLALADDIQADDSSVGSTATDPDRPSMTARARSNSASSSSTSGKSVASVFDTEEFKRWERRKARTEKKERRAELDAALQHSNEQNNATLLSRLSENNATLLSQLSALIVPIQQGLTNTQQQVAALKTAQNTMQLTIATTVETEVQRQLEQSNTVTQTLRGDLLAATESANQQQRTLTTATTRTNEAVAQFKAAISSSMKRPPRHWRIISRVKLNSSRP